MAASAQPSVAAPEVFRARKVGRARRARIDLFPYLLVAPAVLVVAFVTVYPAKSAI
jgi:hypothetical protein